MRCEKDSPTKHIVVVSEDGSETIIDKGVVIGIDYDNAQYETHFSNVKPREILGICGMAGSVASRVREDMKAAGLSSMLKEDDGKC